MSLFIPDHIRQTNLRTFGIDETTIKNTYDNFDFRQEYEPRMVLYLKEFKETSNKRYLFMCTQIWDESPYDNLCFAYWIPENIVSENLYDTLIKFANMFGLTMRYKDTVGKFLKLIKIQKKSDKKFNPMDYVQIVGPSSIPCHHSGFFSENSDCVSLHNSFCINDFRYFGWLDDVEMMQISAPKNWLNWLNEVADSLEPNGKTKLSILKKDRKGVNSEPKDVTDELGKVIIPSKYEKPFLQIIEQINKLNPDEYIVVIPDFPNEMKKCLFCESTDLSKEHIYPKWLCEFFPIQIMDSTFNVTLDENQDIKQVLSNPVSKGHKESTHGYTSQNVCVKCNGTWMSKLEESVKSILTDESGFVKDLAINNLTEEEKKTLSLWLIMKVLLLANKNIQYFLNFDRKSYYSIKEAVIPDGFVVEMITSEFSQLQYCINSGNSKLYFIDEKIKNDKDAINFLNENYFFAVLQFGNLIFRVSYLPDNDLIKRVSRIKEPKLIYPDFPLFEFVSTDKDEKVWDLAKDANTRLMMFNFFGLPIAKK